MYKYTPGRFESEINTKPSDSAGVRQNINFDIISFFGR